MAVRGYGGIGVSGYMRAWAYEGMAVWPHGGTCDWAYGFMDYGVIRLRAGWAMILWVYVHGHMGVRGYGRMGI